MECAIMRHLGVYFSRKLDSPRFTRLSTVSPFFSSAAWVVSSISVTKRHTNPNWNVILWHPASWVWSFDDLSVVLFAVRQNLCLDENCGWVLGQRVDDQTTAASENESEEARQGERPRELTPVPNSRMSLLPSTWLASLGQSRDLLAASCAGENRVGN